MMSKVPEWVKEVSYHVYQATGLEPKGKRTYWIRQMNDLWEASGRNEKILIGGLQHGENKRQEEERVFVSPHAYLSYVKNYRSLAMKRGIT